eukprot:8229474-Alexandrium_andersonii.AAC.1
MLKLLWAGIAAARLPDPQLVLIELDTDLGQRSPHLRNEGGGVLTVHDTDEVIKVGANVPARIVLEPLDDRAPDRDGECCW